MKLYTERLLKVNFNVRTNGNFNLSQQQNECAMHECLTIMFK